MRFNLTKIAGLMFMATVLTVGCGGGGSSNSPSSTPPGDGSGSGSGGSTQPGGGTGTNPGTNPGTASLCASGAAPAFPGAEGFGACVTGGRGGRVIHVTTLAANGPGSLQEALDAPGARTIVFDVSGVINAVPILSHGDVTIAGQTSPGGITLRGLLVQGDVVCEEAGPPACPNPTVYPENFVIQHLRLRPSGFDDPNGAGDGLRLHHAKRGIIDHVSIGNAEDEAVQVSFSSDITIQYTVLAETVGDHSEFGGMLLNYSDPARDFPLTRLTLHHNVWTRIFGRMPEISRENVPDSGVMDIELANNVLHAHERPIYIASANPLVTPNAPLSYAMNMVGNYSIQRPISQCYGLVAVELGSDPTRPSFTAASSVFFSDNRMNRTNRTDYELIYNANDYCDVAAANALPWGNSATTRPPQGKDARLPFPQVTYEPSGPALATRLAARAGAFPRDPMDTRVLGYVGSSTFDPAPININPAGDALSLAFATAPAAQVDTDRDGIPDTWEIANHLNPNDPSDAQQTGLSMAVLGTAGYTNLEVYLHQRSQQLVGQ